MLHIHLACFVASSHKEPIMIPIHPACFRLTIASLLKERDLITQFSPLSCLFIAIYIYYIHSLLKSRAT